ncbi:hypothetical protein HN51_018644 [Arachis hypogaea]|nr:uncharacterized protein DS421_8g231740 [Arachis hypogaea]
MLKQSPSRNQRTKSFKVKQGFQIFTLIVVAIWLIYQLKHSHEDSPRDDEVAKLGRKVLNPYELIDDTEESKPQRVEEEEHEEVEDLIDEEDKEKEEEIQDEEEIIEKQNLLQGQGQSQREINTGV